MASPVDREGHFRAEIVEYGMCQSSDSGSQTVGVQIKARLTEMWDHDSQQWHPWAEYDQEANGTLWIVKKDGTLNDLSCRSLVQHAGWNADIEAIANEQWQPTPCQVQVKSETYKNKTQFRIAFVNDFNKVPGAMGTLDESTVAALKNQHGSALRALFATAKTQSDPKPSGKPNPPPRKSPPPTSGAPVDEVPF